MWGSPLSSPMMSVCISCLGKCSAETWQHKWISILSCIVIQMSIREESYCFCLTSAYLCFLKLGPSHFGLFLYPFVNFFAALCRENIFSGAQGQHYSPVKCLKVLVRSRVKVFLNKKRNRWVLQSLKVSERKGTPHDSVAVVFPCIK